MQDIPLSIQENELNHRENVRELSKIKPIPW